MKYQRAVAWEKGSCKTYEIQKHSRSTYRCDSQEVTKITRNSIHRQQGTPPIWRWRSEDHEEVKVPQNSAQHRLLQHKAHKSKECHTACEVQTKRTLPPMSRHDCWKLSAATMDILDTDNAQHKRHAPIRSHSQEGGKTRKKLRIHIRAQRAGLSTEKKDTH